MAHAVDMPPGLQVVQAVQHQVKAIKEIYAKALLFDIGLPQLTPFIEKSVS